MGIKMHMREHETSLDRFCRRGSFYGKCGVLNVDGVLILRSYNVRNYAAIYKGRLVRGYKGEHADSATSLNHLAAFADYAKIEYHGKSGKGKNDPYALRNAPFVDGYYKTAETFAADVRAVVDWEEGKRKSA